MNRFSSGSLSVILDITANGALILAVIPPAVFLGVSFKLKSDTQVVIAAIMSILYAFIMMIAAFFILGTLATSSTKFKEGSWL